MKYFVREKSGVRVPPVVVFPPFLPYVYLGTYHDVHKFKRQLFHINMNHVLIFTYIQDTNMLIHPGQLMSYIQ